MRKGQKIMEELHVKFTKPGEVRIERKFCPTCGKRRFFVGWFEDWYGWYFTCLRCGERFADGEMMERPFTPKWRQHNIESIKKFYRRHKQISSQ
jgi:hypothetical protein